MHECGRGLEHARGQAAVEYLITYAWVFIAIAVIIGVLYSLVGIREIHIQEACTAAPGWYCDALRFSIRDEPLGERRILKMNGSLANGLGFGAVPTELNITIAAPALEGTYTIRAVGCSPPHCCTGPVPCGGYITPSLVMSGGELSVYLSIPYTGDAIPPGSMFRVRFALAYNSSVTGSALRTAGTLYRRST